MSPVAAMNWASYFQLAAAAIGIVGVVVGAAVYTRSRLSFELLRGDLEDSRRRADGYRQEREDLKQDKAHLEGELLQLKQRVGMLEDLATRAPDVAALVGEVKTLVGVVRADYAHLAPLLGMLAESGLRGRSDKG